VSTDLLLLPPNFDSQRPNNLPLTTTVSTVLTGRTAIVLYPFLPTLHQHHTLPKTASFLRAIIRRTAVRADTIPALRAIVCFYFFGCLLLLNCPRMRFLVQTTDELFQILFDTLAYRSARPLIPCPTFPATVTHAAQLDIIREWPKWEMMHISTPQERRSDVGSCLLMVSFEA